MLKQEGSMRVHKPICSNADYYTDHKDYQSACGGSTKNKKHPFLSKLEYLISEDMKLLKLNPLSSIDINLYWRDLL